jgi:hypothetical protein
MRRCHRPRAPGVPRTFLSSIPARRIPRAPGDVGGNVTGLLCDPAGNAGISDATVSMTISH